MITVSERKCSISEHFRSKTAIMAFAKPTRGDQLGVVVVGVPKGPLGSLSVPMDAFRALPGASLVPLIPLVTPAALPSAEIDNSLQKGHTQR
jgi:hypothetical protein